MSMGGRARGKLVITALLSACVASLVAEALRIDLEKAELMALGASSELRTLEDKTSSAIYALKLGLRDYLPQLSFEYRDSSNIVTGGADASSIQWSVTVVQPLYDGGRRARQRKLAEVDIDLQRRSIQDKKREICESVDAAYHRILMLERKIEIQRDTLAITEKELEIARAQRALGSIREVDLLESELQKSSLELSLQSSEAELEESEFNLWQLLGLRYSEAIDLVDDFDAEYCGLTLPEGAGFFDALVLEGNLALRQRQAELRKKLAALVESRQWYLPNVSFEGSLSLSGDRYPLQSASVNGKLAFEIPAPTSPTSFSFSAGSSTGKQKPSGSSLQVDPLKELASLAERRASAREYAIFRQQIEDMSAALEFQVKKSLVAYVRDKASLDEQRKDLVLQQKTAEIQKRLVDIGEARRVDYLKTLTKAAEGESTILESILNIKQSERELERLIGIERGALVRVSSAFVSKGK
jgi:outer membrane protein TolC